MRKLTLAALVAALPLIAQAEDAAIAIDTQLGMSEEDVQTALTAMGYEVRKMEIEDGMIEAYAVKGDEMLEVYVSPETGKVTKIGEEG